MSALTSPLAIVVFLSIVIGLAMVVLFGYTSDQKAIGAAKDQLKAHLLAVRLFRDQLPVVMGSYGKILRGTARYLKLAFMPLLYVIIPITILIVQVDRYLGVMPVETNTPFLLTVRTTGTENLESVSLELPPELGMTAPPVHIPADNEIVWRVAGAKEGNYKVRINGLNGDVSKTIAIGKGVPRISPVRLRGQMLDRWLSSAEPALPQNGGVESITVSYPLRNIDVAGFEINWIWLFFILSMIAGFAFKEMLGIKI